MPIVQQYADGVVFRRRQFTKPSTSPGRTTSSTPPSGPISLSSDHRRRHSPGSNQPYCANSPATCGSQVSFSSTGRSSSATGRNSTRSSIASIIYPVAPRPCLVQRRLQPAPASPRPAPAQPLASPPSPPATVGWHSAGGRFRGAHWRYSTGQGPARRRVRRRASHQRRWGDPYGRQRARTRLVRIRALWDQPLRLRPHGSGPYGSGPYGSGPYGSGPYGSGPYGPGGYEYGGYGPPPPPRRRGRGMLTHLLVAVLAAALAAGVVLAVYRPSPSSSAPATGVPSGNAVPAPRQRPAQRPGERQRAGRGQ